MSSVVVSTHLDDAVLSAYRVLSAETTVITALAAVPPLPGVGAWDAAGGAKDSHDRVLQRREEDRRALSLSGAAYVHLDLSEAQHSSVGLLPVTNLDDIVPALRDLVIDAEVVYAPACIFNAEHKLVRDATLTVRPDAILYADLPYALHPDMGGFALPPDLAAGRDRHAATVHLSEDEIEEKLQAVQCYETQLEQLTEIFGDFIRPEGLGREVFWPLGETRGRNDPCWCGSGKKQKKCHA